MTNDEVASLIQLNMKSIQDGVARGMLKNLSLSGPYEPHGAGHFVIHVLLVHDAGGLTEYVLVSPDEINALLGTDVKTADGGRLIELLEYKGEQVGYSMAQVIGRSGARDLEWQRTLWVYPPDPWPNGIKDSWKAWTDSWKAWTRKIRGLGRRLRWAWTGIIPIR